MTVETDSHDDTLVEEVARAKSGDRGAFDTIVTKLHRRLLAVCKVRCQGHGDHEDVAQIVWMEVWKNLASFEGTTMHDIRNFAFMKASQRAICNYRRYRRFPGQLPTDNDGSAIDVSSEQVPVLEQVVRREEWQILRDCIEHHKESESVQTWRLHKIEGKSYDEIAGSESIPKNTVGRRIHRANEILSRCVERIGS